MAELNEFSEIEKALKKEFYGELPPIIPCRDTLIHIVVDIEKDYDEAERLFSLLAQKGLFTQEEVEKKLKNLKIEGEI